MVIPSIKDFKLYMSIYILDQSGKDLYQRVSQENMMDIAERIDRHIGKARKIQKATEVRH